MPLSLVPHSSLYSRLESRMFLKAYKHVFAAQLPPPFLQRLEIQSPSDGVAGTVCGLFRLEPVGAPVTSF